MDVEHKFRRARVRRGDAGSGGLRSEGDLARDIDGMKDCFKISQREGRISVTYICDNRF